MRNRYFLLLDVLLLSAIPFVSLYLRVDKEAWSGQYTRALLLFTALALSIKLSVFYAMGLYRRYWRYASVDDLTTIVLTVGSSAAFIAVVFLSAQALGVVPPTGLPRSVPFIDGVLTLLAVGGTRFSVRAVASARRARNKNDQPENKRVLVVGAGDAGAMIVREMQNSARVRLEPVGFVDDDKKKHGMSILGVPVLGSPKDIPRLVADYGIQEVIIAMPTAPGKVIRDIVALCEAAQVTSRTMPGIYEILSGRVGVSQLRNVEIEDLLRREPVEIDSEEVARMLAGARVMITGGGGSIGSELCRQIARCGPARLTLVGHGENSLFIIENELRLNWPNLLLDVVVADIRDRPRLEVVFERTWPQVVFHAAAHKHVPLMERNLEDAITNNVGGTRNLVRISERFGVERFVLISSDKAVNPANVMGATKQVAEIIVQEAARRTGRPYVSVRFGNVLGSRGSVVPIFRKQIARGGPVTVTHPDVCRYFMTIPEAVQLVLQAAALGRAGGNGEVFVLDMGEPIKITDLARDLIELSGLEVGRDIEIVFTGLRPGEKLNEELFVPGEEQRRTRHEKIFVAHRGGTSAVLTATEPRAFDALVSRLIQAAEDGRLVEIRQSLRSLVPDYNPAEMTPDGCGVPSESSRPAFTDAFFPPALSADPEGREAIVE
jgi:FlaA1/EpsC-like NDP-sugar epimerase